VLPVKSDKKAFRYTICVSGAASGHTVKESANLAEALGRAVARSGHILTTGATVGLPYYAAYGAKQEGGMSIGFSPATNLREHLRKYRLPRDCFDFINFTGMKYSGRDLYLIQSSDAVITVGGRFGSLQEFASALELHKPAGVLLGSGGTADLIPELMRILEPPDNEIVIFDKDPARLVNRLIELLDEKYADIHAQLDKHDQTWFLDHEAHGTHSG
jgi:uncharacterized protein (TIGR00725 family)